MYAIIETGGKQYRVSEGTICNVEKLDTGVGEEVVFDKVLLINDEDRTEVGSPYLTGRKVSAKVLAHGKGKKLLSLSLSQEKLQAETGPPPAFYPGGNRKNFMSNCG